MGNELGRFWDQLPHIDGTVIRYMAKDRGGLVRGGFVTTLKELEYAIRDYKGWNFYICPNPSTSRTGIRHSSKDVSHWSWVLIDLDPVATTYQPGLAVLQATGSLSNLLGLILLPLIINSGRGIQAWIRLDDHVLNESNRKKASQAMRYFLHELDNNIGVSFGCRIDTCTSDLPRPMRCPTTVNQRTGEIAHVVEYGEIHRAPMDYYLSRVPEKEFVIEVETTGHLIGHRWQDAAAHLTPTARAFLASGTQEPGRHKDAFHTAKKLQELGISYEETSKALAWGNKLCRNGLGELSPLSPKDLKHALDMAFKP